jgi:hypothetical protein
MFTGDTPTAYIYKLVGEDLVPVTKPQERFLAVLDKEKPEETFIAQEFDSGDLWGKTYRLKLSADQLVEKGEIEFPDGFRIDSAMAFDDLLMFVDDKGTLRVFRGDSQIFTMKGFGGSYITVEVMGLVEDTESYIFYPKPFTVFVGEKSYPGVIRNLTSPVYKFLNVAKYTEGELFLLVPEEDEIRPLKIKSRKFEESIQAVLSDDDGNFVVITAKKGTLSIQNSGEIYLGTLKVR